MIGAGAGGKNTDAEIRDGVWNDSTKANGADIGNIATDLEGRKISGNTGSIAAATPTDCSAIIGQNGKRSILQGGIIKGIQNMNAGKKVTVRVYKYNGTGWDPVDKYDVTKDSGLEANIGQAAHDDYMRVSVEHDDSVNRTFTYVFVVQDMEQ